MAAQQEASRSKRPARMEIAIRVGVVVSLAAAIVGGGVEGARQLAAQNLELIATETSEAALERNHLVGALAQARGWEHLCGGICPVRAKLASAAVRTNVVALRAETSRDVLLGEAETLLASALAAEPLNADVFVHRAFLNVVREQAVGPSVLDDLRRSYELQPFNRYSGLWRVRVAGDNWSKLSPAMRRKVLDEAQWLWIVRPAQRQAITAAFTSPAASIAFELRLASPRRVTIKRESIH